MSQIADEIVALPSGAKFVRADLHIHSYPVSHDVKDSAMSPEEIVRTAVRENLQIISITDHNEIGAVKGLIESCAQSGILAIPGVELSTNEGHLLVYFRDYADLVIYYGKLDIVDRGTKDSRCQTAMLDCLKLIDPSAGFGILAHVDGAGGLEDRMPGHTPHKGDILNCASLLGIELKNASSQISYAHGDPDPARIEFGKKRIAKLQLGQQQNLARVLFSDSHSLASLGHNAQGSRKVTRIKMDAPSYEGVRLALQDADARIRLEDEIPTSIPYLMGLKFDGGFLDGQTIHLSKNLNCIIGGRGAGKSTAIEAARFVSETESPSALVDSEIWPNVLTLVWVDQSEQQHTIQRRLQEPAVNLEDVLMGPVTFPMEAYSQNETAETSREAKRDPSALLRYLDSFIDFGSLKTDLQMKRADLLKSQNEIEEATREVAKIPDYKKYLSNTQQQLKTIEKTKATQVVGLERRVADERALRSSIERRMSEIVSHAKGSPVLDVVEQIHKLKPSRDLEIGKEEFSKIEELVAEFEGNARESKEAVAKYGAALSSAAKVYLDTWKAKEQRIVAQIEEKRRELAAEGIKLDLAYIQKLAKDEAEFAKTLANLQLWEKRLRELKLQRATLLRERDGITGRIEALRVAFAMKATSSLENVLGDLDVSVKFAGGALSEEAEGIIQRAMGWKTVQVPKASLIVEQVSVPRLLDSIRRTDPKALMDVISADGMKVFGKTEALTILTTLRQETNLFPLERCEVEDRPRITVTKKMDGPGGPKFVSREFTKLSLGQQQSVLLSLMLLSDSSAPLIIDQPEDNLDGEFIYHSLVPVLRRAKERRQVIIVTHNANIAVLGDAEQIIALKSTSDRSSIVARGSIDDTSTRQAACRILEGAEEAFKRRARMYGL